MEPRQSEIGNWQSAMTCGSDVAGNMRVFQTRFESSNLSCCLLFSALLIRENPRLSAANNQNERRCRVMPLNGRVLLLNQTYEPLGTVSVARAIIMTFKNTVTVEELDGDRVLHSPHAEYPVPSVIRRRTYINIRRRREASATRRLRIYMRDKFRCQYCGEKKPAAALTFDHILPRSRGGDNSPVNVVTACIKCNNRKSNRTPEEARMPLLTSQSALRVNSSVWFFATMPRLGPSGGSISSWMNKRSWVLGLRSLMFRAKSRVSSP